MRLFLVMVVGLLVASPGVALAYTQTFATSGNPIVGEDENFDPDVTVEFSYDTGCASDCELTIVLTYNDSGGLDTIGQTWHEIYEDWLARSEEYAEDECRPCYECFPPGADRGEVSLTINVAIKNR